jgi:3-oxoadipate CoA-transferase beta subunit
VRRVYTNLAVIDVKPEGLFVSEIVPGMTLERLQAMTEPKLHLAAGYQLLKLPPIAA